VQRVIAHPAINGVFLDALVPKVKAIRYGDPSSPDTTHSSTPGVAEQVAPHLRRISRGAPSPLNSFGGEIVIIV
jgi:hypothetical protein